MKLYHGSNTDIKNINLAVCRPYKDFGTGFYLTEIEMQATNMANRVSKIYGGTPVVNVYEFDEKLILDGTMKVKDFGEYTSVEWAQFVMNNRNKKYDDYSNPLCNFDCKYDIVIGPIADDNMAMLFRQYENEVIDFNTLMNGITYKKISNQYSFHTLKALRLLRKVGALNE